MEAGSSNCVIPGSGASRCFIFFCCSLPPLLFFFPSILTLSIFTISILQASTRVGVLCLTARHITQMLRPRRSAFGVLVFLFSCVLPGSACFRDSTSVWFSLMARCRTRESPWTVCSPLAWCQKSSASRELLAGLRCCVLVFWV